MSSPPETAPRASRRRARLGALLLGGALFFVLLEVVLAVVAAVRAPRDVYAGGSMRELGREGAGERARPAGERTILCIGDSHTFGVHLEREQSYPGQLQALLERAPGSPWRVVNVGYPGRNSAEVRARLAREIETWQAEIVICWVGMNNTWSFAERQQWESPEREVRPGALEAAWQSLRTPKLARMAWNKLAGGEEDQQVITPARLRETLFIDWRRIQAICREHGAKLLMADYPVHIDYPRRQVNGNLHRIAEELGIPLVPIHDELLPVFYGLGYERTMLGDWHANEHGYYAIARRFLHELIARGWLEERAEWLSAPPLWQRLEAWPIRVVEADGERATVLLSGPPNGRYALNLRCLTSVEHDRTRRKATPCAWFQALDGTERERLGWTGALDGAGRARLELALPPEPEGLVEGLGPDARWLGWNLRVRMGDPSGEVALDDALSFAEVLLDPTIRRAP
jgi:lysophospholipase L1-like esterase